MNPHENPQTKVAMEMTYGMTIPRESVCVWKWPRFVFTCTEDCEKNHDPVAKDVYLGVNTRVAELSCVVDRNACFRSTLGEHRWEASLTRLQRR